MAAVAASVGLAAWLTVKSQPKFTEQWRATGALNGKIEEDCTGHTLIKVFRHQAAARAQFDSDNAALYGSSYGAQALSGAAQPAILFIGNLVFTGVALVGGLSVIGGQVTLGLLQAFVQYSRQLTQPLSQMSSMTGSTQSGLASTERVFEFLDAPELPAEAVQALRGVDRGGQAGGQVEGGGVDRGGDRAQERGAAGDGGAGLRAQMTLSLSLSGRLPAGPPPPVS